MCTPVAALTAGSGILSAVGGHQSQAAAASAANKAAINNYEYQIAQRENEWRQTLTAWGHKKIQYEAQTGENFMAANRGYSQEQQRLNEIYQKAAFTNQDQMAELLTKQGMNLAGGGQGQSAQRSNNMMLAALGRSQAQTAASLGSARNAYKTKVDGIRDELSSANREAFSSVALKPMAGIAPPAPVMQSGPSALSLIGGIGSAVAGGFGAVNSAPDAGQIPTPQAPAAPSQSFGSLKINPFSSNAPLTASPWGNSYDFFSSNNNFLN